MSMYAFVSVYMCIYMGVGEGGREGESIRARKRGKKKKAVQSVHGRGKKTREEEREGEEGGRTR